MNTQKTLEFALENFPMGKRIWCLETQQYHKVMKGPEVHKNEVVVWLTNQSSYTNIKLIRKGASSARQSKEENGASRTLPTNESTQQNQETETTGRSGNQECGVALADN